MYSFLDNETAVHLDSPLPSGVLDVKDGLASKIIFGLNSQVLSFLLELFTRKLCFFACSYGIEILNFFVSGT